MFRWTETHCFSLPVDHLILSYQLLFSHKNSFSIQSIENCVVEYYVSTQNHRCGDVFLDRSTNYRVRQRQNLSKISTNSIWSYRRSSTKNLNNGQMTCKSSSLLLKVGWCRLRHTSHGFCRLTHKLWSWSVHFHVQAIACVGFFHTIVWHFLFSHTEASVKKRV